uniref:ferredoxin:thioredoxin reductase n=1 Tax=Monodopsis sp. MarTras21 TaxID=1745953 RepID=A0A451FLH0_9STRA|nr:plastid ferredoxin-thioredoxin reductase beta subunit [Monodopsis sp. MarTras21]
MNVDMLIPKLLSLLLLWVTIVRGFIPPAPGQQKSQGHPKAPVSRPVLVPPSELVLSATEVPSEASKAGSAGTLKAMQKFAEKYCEITDTYFCSDLEIAATVVKGLAKHKDEYGAPLCPCRHYEDKAAEVSIAYWNCPCVPMRERKECHCMLFLTPDNPFVGKEQKLPDDVLAKVQV